jgi:lycopene beta-cyclase
VITGGDFAAFQAAQRVPGVAVAGARGGFVHPLTSYTLPFAVEAALAIAQDADLPGSQLAAMLEARARSHWRATAFYRKLGTMLFAAAEPDQRYRVFERFYRLPEGLIERFYAARSTRLDRMRILCGKPPVPISGALAALTGRRPMAPLEQAA